MRQIDDPVRLRRRAANLERGPGTRVDPGVLARHIGGSRFALARRCGCDRVTVSPEPKDSMGRAARKWQLRRCF